MMNELKWNKFHLKAPARIIWNIDRNVSVHCPQGLPKNIICDMLRKYGKFLRFDNKYAKKRSSTCIFYRKLFEPCLTIAKMLESIYF